MVSQYQEPMVLATIITPDEYVSEIISLIMVICFLDAAQLNCTA